MSDDLARARARVAAGSWLAQYCGVQDPKTMTFSVAELLAAFEAGYLMCICEDVLAGDQLLLTATMLDAASSGGPLTTSDMERAAKTIYAARDELALERATGQRQLDDATALMTEALELFRGYYSHHRDKADARWDAGDAIGSTESNGKAQTNALMAARLEAWLAGKDQYPVSVGAMMSGIDEISTLPGDPHKIGAVTVGVVRERPDDAHPGIAAGGFVKEMSPVDVPAVLVAGDWPTPNPARVLAQIGETMVDGVAIKGVDDKSFNDAAAYLDQPVEISAINGPPMQDPELTSRIWADAVAEHEGAAPTLTEERAVACAASGFIPWAGGDGPPADWDKGEVLLDWGNELSRPDRGDPRFTICPGMELHPEPGLWQADRDPTSYATIIGYRSTIAKAATPVARVAAEPSPIAALIQARNWLMSAEQLIAAAAEHIRGVTGALPGSDSADLVARLDAWLCPLATRPADEGAEKEARRTSTTHQGE